MRTDNLIKAVLFFVFAALIQAPLFAQQGKAKNTDSARPRTESPVAKPVPAEKESKMGKEDEQQPAGKQKEKQAKDKPAKKESKDKSKAKEQRGNAYGKNKGDKKGREFGQQRAEEARSKNDDKPKKGGAQKEKEKKQVEKKEMEKKQANEAAKNKNKQ